MQNNSIQVIGRPVFSQQKKDIPKIQQDTRMPGLRLIYLLTFVYLICVCLNMFAPTKDVSFIYYGKHLLLMGSSFVYFIYRATMKTIRYEKAISWIYGMLLLKSLLNMFVSDVDGFYVYVLQDVSILAFFHMIGICINSQKMFYKIQKFLFKSLSLILIGCYAYAKTQGLQMSGIWARDRLVFGFTHPGYLGAIITVAIISEVCSFIGKKQGFIKKFNLIDFGLVALLSYWLMQNMSRNALVAIVVFVFIMFIRIAFRQTSTLVMYFLAIFVLTPVAIYSIYAFDLISTLSSNRLAIWTDFIKRSFDTNNWSLLIGQGIWLMPDLDTMSRGHIDNYYIELLYESGTVIFAIFVIGIIRLFRGLLKSRSQIKNISVASLFVILAYGFFDSAFLTFGSIISVYAWFNIIVGLNSRLDDLN